MPIQHALPTGLIQKMLLPLIIGFVIRQLNKFGATTNWDLVRKDAAKRVEDLLPGVWFDELGVAVANAAIKIVEDFIKSDTDEQVIKLLAEGKYVEAYFLLLNFVKDQLF